MAGLRTGALLDGSAQFWAKSSDYYVKHLSKFGLPQLAPLRDSGAIDERKLNTKMRVIATVRLGSELLEIVVKILEEIMTPIILGNNVLKLVHLDDPGGVMTLGESKIKVDNYYESIEKVVEQPEEVDYDDVYVLEEQVHLGRSLHWGTTKEFSNEETSEILKKLVQG